MVSDWMAGVRYSTRAGIFILPTLSGPALELNHPPVGALAGGQRDRSMKLITIWWQRQECLNICLRFSIHRLLVGLICGNNKLTPFVLAEWLALLLRIRVQISVRRRRFFVCFFSRCSKCWDSTLNSWPLPFTYFPFYYSHCPPFWRYTVGDTVCIVK